MLEKSCRIWYNERDRMAILLVLRFYRRALRCGRFATGTVRAPSRVLRRATARAKSSLRDIWIFYVRCRVFVEGMVAENNRHIPRKTPYRRRRAGVARCGRRDISGMPGRYCATAPAPCAAKKGFFRAWDGEIGAVGKAGGT